MARRANGQGTIKKRKDGRWVGVISQGFKDGKRVQKAVYGKTQSEVVKKLDAERAKQARNEKAVLGRDTVEAFLKRWLKDDVEINCTRKTFSGYEYDLKKYVFVEDPEKKGEADTGKPTMRLGHLKLNKLTSEKIQEWQGSLARAGKSANLRKKLLAVLRVGLNSAVRLGLISSNPCNAVVKPKVTRKQVTPLEPEDVMALLKACKAHRIGGVIALACLTGMRKGELFALEWSAVNLKEGVLSVRQSLEEVSGELKLKAPKTESGRRVVNLDSEAISVLENRKKKATEEGLGDCSLVFPDTNGEWLRGSNFDRRVWYPIREAAGIPKVKFHDLRHTQASLLLASGVDLKVIQARLGHSSFELTMNTYAHLLQGAQADAVEKLSGLLKNTKATQSPRVDPQS